MNYNKNLAIIDADSLVYIIGSKHKILKLKSIGITALDNFIIDILKSTKSNKYIGYFGKIGSRNFRYDVAVTVGYKSGRKKQKEDWHKFWEPILKERMETYWKFIPVDKVEADDACAIAANHYRDRFQKVTVASPDKDLLQIGDMHFYNYSKGMSFYCNQSTSDEKFAMSLITGDTCDSIPGLPNAGAVTANKVIQKFVKDEKNIIKETEGYYTTWFKEIAVDKELAIQEKSYLTMYKSTHDIKVLRAAKKSEALKDFKADMSFIKTDEEIAIYYKEMYTLLRMLETKAEGKKYGFKLTKPVKCALINWDEIMNYEEGLEDIEEENLHIDNDIMDNL
jgi:5'-3' exonuclease